MAHTNNAGREVGEAFPLQGRWGQPTRSLPPPGIQLPAEESVTPTQVELLGLGVMVEVLDRMSPDERRRSLAYLNDRFGPPSRNAEEIRLQLTGVEARAAQEARRQQLADLERVDRMREERR